VLCAAEPTSGLDSFTAVTVVESLQRLCRGVRKTTIIASIHQPRADVFYLFDSIMLLTKGHVVYCGKTANVVDYFSAIHPDYSCPADSNPADFYVDLCSVDPRSKAIESASAGRVRRLVKKASATCNIVSSTGLHKKFNSDVLVNSTACRTSPDTTQMVAWPTQFVALFWRFVLNNFRNPFYLLGSAFQG
jgi:ABC-type multidrug transport system ATPase subunit